MKKLLGIVLIGLLLCNLGFPAAAAETLLSRAEIPLADSEADMLYSLGLLLGTENGLDLERNVSRAEAAVLLCRLFGQQPANGVQGMFSDVSSDHWAAAFIELAKENGYIQGTSQATFEPDRTVTGKEFVKILLSAMGFTGITLENAYDKGIEQTLLNNNYTKSVVYHDETLLRSDIARLCHSALVCTLPDGTFLYRRLAEKGLFTMEEAQEILGCGHSLPQKSGFADQVNAMMPINQNYMVSPLSIKMALAMLANGAEGETQEEILTACGINDLEGFNANVRTMLDKYSKTDLLNLNIANSIWINTSKTSQKFSKSYQEKLEAFYNGTSGEVTDENALEVINGWVNEKTNQKIPEILQDSEFWSCLVNAIYFRAVWSHEFNEAATAKAEFTNRDGTKHQIDFMNRTDYMNYYEGDGLQAVELPYQNRIDRFSEDGQYLDTEHFDDLDISMYLLMGNAKVMDAEKLLSEKEFSSRYVALRMPKFEIAYQTQLKDPLNALGISKAFQLESAEFTPMFDYGNMAVTDAVHKAYIKVDEKGTEAAAVTMIGMAGSGLPPEPVIFCADKPFTFVIRDNISEEILFIGEFSFAE